MKRIFVTLSAIALLAFAAQANAAGMYAGVKAGANFANVGGSDAPDNTSTRTGFQGGLFVGKQVNEKFGFRVEGLYVQKGAKGKASSSSSSSSDVTEKLDYIEFPILFVYDLKSTEKMGFNLFAGPTLGFNMAAKVEDTDIKDNIQSFEFGGAIGAGVEKKMAGGKAITFDARYSLGATTVAKDVTVASTTVSPDIKNRGIGLMIGYQIPIGGSAK